MPYVDGFIVPVPKKNLEAYVRMSKKCGKIWREYGALDYREWVAEDVKVGKIYTGRVSTVKEFGAFIEVIPGQDGLCHISELADDYVKSVEDVCKIGDELRVKVIAIDEQGRVKLSRKAALKEEGELAST